MSSRALALLQQVLPVLPLFNELAQELAENSTVAFDKEEKQPEEEKPTVDTGATIAL